MCIYTLPTTHCSQCGPVAEGKHFLRAHFPARRCYDLSKNSAGLGNVECHPHAFAPSLPHCLSHGSVMSAGASWTVQVTTCTGTGTGPHGAQWGTHDANTKSGAFLHWGDNVSTSQERFCYKLIMFTFDTTSSTRLELYGSKVKPYSSNLELYSSIQNWFSIKITF